MDAIKLANLNDNLRLVLFKNVCIISYIGMSSIPLVSKLNPQATFIPFAISHLALSFKSDILHVYHDVPIFIRQVYNIHKPPYVRCNTLVFNLDVHHSENECMGLCWVKSCMCVCK